MSFPFFKSKKGQDKAQAASKGDNTNGIAGSQASLSGPNGRSISEKGAVQPTSTPGSSVNNSLNSLGGTTPSPEQISGRRVTSTEPANDLPLRNMTAPAVQPVSSTTSPNPNSSLYPWSQRRVTFTSSHPSPFPRYGAAVNSVASKEGDIYMMGGLINSSTVKGDLWMVEAGTANMSCYPLATTAEGPGPRVGHASLLVGNAFIVYGGDTKMDDSDVLDETLYLLNTSTRQWSRAVPAGPRPLGRYGHSLNILGSKIYVFGGQVEGYFMNDLVAFDLNQLQLPSNRWEFLIRNSDDGGPPQGQIPPARTNHSIVTFNDRLYLFGGTNGFQWFNDVWSYDPIANAWSQLDCIGYIPAPREGHAAALVDDVMYIFGGRTEEGADLGDLAAFRISSRRWYTFQNMGPSPSPRSGHSMTAHAKQVVVLAGEPSTASREALDLSIVYVLDTTKIRYPNDQQTPPGERVPGRRPSSSDRTPPGAARNLSSRDGTMGASDPKKLNGVIPRESLVTTPPSHTRLNGLSTLNGNDSPGVTTGSVSSGSKLPRASVMQAPSGPPPQQQAPTPKPNAISAPVISTSSTPRGKPTRPDRGFGPALDTSGSGLSQPQEQEPLSSQSKTISPTRVSPTPKDSLLPNGRRTPTSQVTKSIGRQDMADIPEGEQATEESSRPTSKARQGRLQGSTDSIGESTMRSVAGRPSSPPPPSRPGSGSAARKSSARNSQTVALLKELDAAKNRNAWYASELELAKKSGYTPNPSSNPALDQRATESFAEADRPLIEALIAMRNELANVQGSVDQQATLAAKKIAEVEKQRDAAINEAVYAKAKLAAHGGSQTSTPQPDYESREVGPKSAERSTDISRKLAAALALQRDLQNHTEVLTSEVEAEKRSRQLAEDTANAAHQRISELETYKQQNASEVERLKAELHQLQMTSREHASTCAEAVATAQLLQVDKDHLEVQHRELLDTTKDHGATFDSLRLALGASNDTKDVLERKLEEERVEREKVEEKLRKLRSEHEDRTGELESVSRKLRDAEEMAEKNALEARTHREAVMSGLDKVSSRDIVSSPTTTNNRAIALQTQLDTANTLVRSHQSAADEASQKFRGAEERIAALEASQEQASQESMNIRKQLQAALRETQTLQAANADMKHQLANQQLETNAVHVQHNTLKDLLGERGISPVGTRTRGLSSPQTGADTPDHTRLRDIEQQLLSEKQAHDETKQLYTSREQDAESGYREKLAQLENDYQSAVHYVKGTEKMLKRMKDELSKYKAENIRLKTELDDASEKSEASREVSTAWESERVALHKQIESLQVDLKNSHSLLEKQLLDVRKELQTSQQERDKLKQSHEETTKQLSTSVEQSKSDLAQLQHENSLLEKRAVDAEQKVSLLLDQVESSVDNYRRQSRLAGEPNGAHSGGHVRNHSGHDSVSGGSEYSATADRANRTSMALDSLASELETLRTHWETTNKNYGHSNNYDFERPAANEEGRAEGVGLSHNLADWRRRLDHEEHEANARKSNINEGQGNVI